MGNLNRHSFLRNAVSHPLCCQARLLHLVLRVPVILGCGAYRRPSREIPGGCHTGSSMRAVFLFAPFGLFCASSSSIRRSQISMDRTASDPAGGYDLPSEDFL